MTEKTKSLQAGSLGDRTKTSTTTPATPAHTPLPCPFCGGEGSADGRIAYSPRYDAEWADGTKVTTAYFCNCIRCGVRNGEHQTKAEALAKWNTRAALSQAGGAGE